MKMITRIAGASIVASFIIGIGINESRASLIGSSVDVSTDYPTETAVYSDGGVKVVGNGVEYPTGSFSGYNPYFSVDLSGNQIIISNAVGTDFTGGVSFNGFVIKDLSGSFLSATADAASNFSPV
jgi:hypothetical protein